MDTIDPIDPIDLTRAGVEIYVRGNGRVLEKPARPLQAVRPVALGYLARAGFLVKAVESAQFAGQARPSASCVTFG
jgi:hypothetical protein